MHAVMIALLASVTVSPTAAPQAPLRLVRIPTASPHALAEQLRPLGVDLDHEHTYAGGLEFVVTADEHQTLLDMGHPADLVREGQPLRDAVPEGIPGGYPDLDAIYDQMADAASRRPDICTIVDLTATYGTPPTHEGRHLFAARISDNVDDDEAEPAVLIVTTHHAREIGTPIVALRAIDNLVDNHGINPRITDAVNDHEIWIAPMWNPDGYHHVYHVDDFWRKNRRDNGDGNFGVDLNRNYPIGWGVCGGSSLPGSSTYKGPAPASEPETQTMLAFAGDRRFARVADVHSYASEVRYGYGCWAHPWDPGFQAIAAQLSTLSGYAGDTGSSCCLGGDIHLHTHQYGAIAFLWEIGTSFHPTFASASAEADNLWPAMLELIDRGSAISGTVTSLATGQPLEAEITVLNAGFTNNERHRSSPRHGLYHAHPPSGTWTLRFEADSYVPTEHTVTISPAQPRAVLDVALEGGCPADLAEPFGVLDLADLQAFIAAFIGQAPPADLAEPFGVFDLQDVQVFIAAFTGGCP